MFPINSAHTETCTPLVYYHARHTKTGNLLWQRCLGGIYDDFARNIFPTTDGGYMIVGSTDSNDGDVEGFHGEVPGYSLHDIWFVKIDSTGNPVWQYCYGGEHDEMIYRGVWQKSDWDYVLAIATGTPEWKCYPSNPPNSYNLYDVRVVELYDSTMVNLTNQTVDNLKIIVYPNPSKNIIKLKFPYNELLNNASVSIFDINGKLMLTMKPKSLITTINTNDFKNGLYFIKIRSKNGIITKKIIIR